MNAGDPQANSRKNRGAIALPADWAVHRPWRQLSATGVLAPLSQILTHEIDRRRLFLWLPVFFGLGVIAYFRAEIEPGLTAPAIAFALCAAAAFSLRTRYGGLVAATAAAAFFAGFGAGVVRTAFVAAPVLASPVFATVDGWIETIDWNVYGGRMIVRVHDMSPAVETMPERVRVTFRGKPEMRSGSAVRLRARLSPPNRSAVPGGFDFQREAYFQRLGAVGFLVGQISPLTLSAAAPLRARIAGAIDDGRNGLTNRIISVVGGSTGAISAALVTGKRGYIPEADNDAMRAAGIYHIVSISGLHMVLAAGLFFWGARLVLVGIPGLATRYPVKKWAAGFAMAGAIAYDVFSGSEVATERSLIMTLVMFGAVLVDRPALAMRNLAIAGLIIMALEPETVLGPSFQMSFAAVAGLVAYGEFEREWRGAAPEASQHWRHQLLGRIWTPVFGILMTTLIAGFATAPFQAYHFHRLNPYGVLGNALAIPLCSFIVMPAALLGVVLLPFGLDAPVWWLMGKGVAGIQDFAGWVAALDGSVTTIRRFGTGALALMTLGLLFAALMTSLAMRLIGAGFLALGMFVASRAELPALILDPGGRIALVRGAEGKMILVGAGRPGFALQQWLPGDLDLRGPRDPSLTKGASCDKAGCTAKLWDGRAVAVVLDRAAFAEDCERAAIIITGLAAPETCWNSADVFDSSYFDSYGATYIYPQGAGWHLETARNARIDRPWSPAPKRSASVVRAENPKPAPDAAPPMPAEPWDNQSPDAQN